METIYIITIGTDAWTKNFKVCAYNKQEAVDLVADRIEAEELTDLYSDHYELADLCENGETVDEYAEANGLTCAGKHGIYIRVLGIQMKFGFCRFLIMNNGKTVSHEESIFKCFELKRRN